VPFFQRDVRRRDVLYELLGMKASLVPKCIDQWIEIGEDHSID
jgi:hypothetical protein